MKVGFYLILLIALSVDVVYAQGTSSGRRVRGRARRGQSRRQYLPRSRAQSGAGRRRLDRHLSVSQLWAVEFEAWMRASNPECCGPRQREMLYSVSVVRLLTTQGLQPYMLGGLTLLQSDSPGAAGAGRRRRAVSSVSPAADGDRSAGQRRRLDDDRQADRGGHL